MLSYMLPIEEKPTSPRNLNLSLNLNGNNNHHHKNLCDENGIDETTKLLLNSERSDCINKNNFLEQNNKESSGRIEGIIVEDTKKYKLGGKTGNTKNVTLKRVSFGSSKNSMVETLVFETPTPLPEHAEREFAFSSENGINGKNHIGSNGSCLDDSGFQEEVERSKVRVTFFQSSKPQQVSPPDNQIPFFGENNNSILIDNSILSETNSIDDKMATTVAVTIQPNYDRQISTESGWDNPFRPGGDLSREADEIVNLIKGGKPITPTGEPQNIANGEIHQKPSENGTTVVDGGAVKLEAPKYQSTQNGTKSPQKQTEKNTTTSTNGDATNKTQTQISNQVLPTPQSASHVIIEDKKKKKCTCCVIQ